MQLVCHGSINYTLEGGGATTEHLLVVASKLYLCSLYASDQKSYRLVTSRKKPATARSPNSY